MPEPCACPASEYDGDRAQLAGVAHLADATASLPACSAGVRMAQNGPVRLTEFWRRMDESFGPHAGSIATDHVFAELGNRTVQQALAAGEPTKDVWRAVCQGMGLPATKR